MLPTVETAAGRRGVGRADDLQLAALHRQADDPRTSRRRPGSRSSTSRTSTTTPSSSASCARSSPRASRAGARSSSPTDWMAEKMYDLGYLQNLDKEAIPNVDREPDPEPAEPVVRPRAQLLGAVAERDDRDHRPQGPGARRHLDQRPLRPQVRGQGHVAHRDARHGAAGDEGRRASIPRTRPTRTGWPRSTRSRRPPTPDRSATSPATTTPTTSPAATSSRRSAGPGTRSSSRPTTRTSSGGCPTRAACSGPTTW